MISEEKLAELSAHYQISQKDFCGVSIDSDKAFRFAYRAAERAASEYSEVNLANYVRLIEENKKLRAALEWYANEAQKDSGVFGEKTFWDNDLGEIARESLK